MIKLPWKKEKEPTALDIRIEECISAIAGMEEGTEEYHQAVEDLKVLVDVKSRLEGHGKIDPNTVVGAGGNFVLGCIVVLVEIFGHTITSKGWPGIGRNKI